MFRESIYIYKYYYNIIALLLYTTHFMEISFFYISISRKIFYCYQEKALYAYAYKYKMLKHFVKTSFLSAYPLETYSVISSFFYFVNKFYLKKKNIFVLSKGYDLSIVKRKTHAKRNIRIRFDQFDAFLTSRRTNSTTVS